MVRKHAQPLPLTELTPQLGKCIGDESYEKKYIKDLIQIGEEVKEMTQELGRIIPVLLVQKLAFVRGKVICLITLQVNKCWGCDPNHLSSMTAHAFPTVCSLPTDICLRE